MRVGTPQKECEKCYPLIDPIPAVVPGAPASLDNHSLAVVLSTANRPQNIPQSFESETDAQNAALIFPGYMSYGGNASTPTPVGYNEVGQLHLVGGLHPVHRDAHYENNQVLMFPSVPSPTSSISSNARDHSHRTPNVEVPATGHHKLRQLVARDHPFGSVLFRDACRMVLPRNITSS
ncbi:hypothetical protein V5O48_010424, partial [Marasmius crinis-equi]